jgi:gas vesicle protein
MKRFLAGLITGYVTSLLIVPQDGKANRARLKATSREQGNQLKAEYQKIVVDTKRLIDAAKKGSGFF